MTHRTDGGKTSYNGDVLKPATTEIEKVAPVTGNSPKAVLEDDVYGAEGYDYVISENINCIKDKDYLQVKKNQLTPDATFAYIPKGTYYVYCHAWFRDKDGKKVFSSWSKPYEYEVTAVTPEQPQITKVKVSGRNVTITYKKSKNAVGYDLVLGDRLANVNDEKRPVDYGTYVKKVTNKNTVTVTFRNINKGVYYVGLHSWNRTSEDKKKVFSPWGTARRINIK